ncbi:MAG: hypothetical protein INR65_13695 [Gluconacetobacter diazotrophicus]|nr:hypothetical protein [Gluconacetobacter diazotrophicus]
MFDGPIGADGFAVGVRDDSRDDGRDGGRTDGRDRVLAMPLAVAAGDETGFLGFGMTRHLGRPRRCGFHAVLHRDGAGGAWTHLYRVVATRGGGRLVLLCRALPGDARAALSARVAPGGA